MCEELETAAEDINQIIDLLRDFSSDGDANGVFKMLRNVTANGSAYQQALTEHPFFYEYLKTKIFVTEEVVPYFIKVILLQTLANSIANNGTTQRRCWLTFGKAIEQQLPLIEKDDKVMNIYLMIIYNVYRGTDELTAKDALKLCLILWNKKMKTRTTFLPDFMQLLFEEFIIHDPQLFIDTFDTLDAHECVALIKYIEIYLSQDDITLPVNEKVIKYLALKFKNLADEVWFKVTNNHDEYPLVVEALLGFLSKATGQEHYAPLLVDDSSIFISASSALLAYLNIEKQPESVLPQPLSKLQDFGPDVANRVEVPYYTFKTNLVRLIGNLLYKNLKNQNYCVDINLLPALLECTTMDARNPLVKEWAILAIRNACEECPKLQYIISRLNAKGMVPTDLLTHFNFEMRPLLSSPII